MRCHKCGGKTVPREASVEVRFGDTMLTTITEVGHCSRCNVQTMRLECRIVPIGGNPEQPVENKMAGIEAKGHA